MKVQEALQSAIDAMIMYQLKLDSTFIDEAIISCKSALSDIEKCEPECNVEGTWLWLKLMGYCNKKGIAPATQNELFAIAGEAHKLYTSPISKEWLDVPYEERRELYKSVSKGNIDGFADLLSARLKQLNAPEKG